MRVCLPRNICQGHPPRAFYPFHPYHFGGSFYCFSRETHHKQNIVARKLSWSKRRMSHFWIFRLAWPVAFLSSFALLMGAFVVMFISSEAEQSPKGNNRSGAQGKKRTKLLHKRIFQSSVNSDPGLHHLCFTSVCDCRTKINRDLFALELLCF